MTFRAMKQDINTVPFEIGLSELPGIEQYSGWILPQALAKINKEFKLVRNTDGLISPSATLVAFCAALGSEKEYLWWTNLLSYLKGTPRGKEVLGPLKPLVLPQYSALVPLALSAFKQYRNVNYSEWDWTDEKIAVFVDKNLLASTFIELPDLTTEQLLDFRTTASLVKSTGATRTSNQMTTIYNVGFDLFDKLPALTKIMLLQTWVAAPGIRHPLQILQPNDIDNMPEPLISVDITSKQSIAKSDSDLMPRWRG